MRSDTSLTETLKINQLIMSPEEAENRADEFAANVLIDAKEYRSFVNEEIIRCLASNSSVKEHNMPYILIGRLQKDRHIKYDQYPNEKLKYDKDGLAHLEFNHITV